MPKFFGIIVNTEVLWVPPPKTGYCRHADA